MKRISRRKSHKQAKVFFYALESMLLRRGFYNRYAKKDRALWIHERKGQPALYSVTETGQVISLREVQPDPDHDLERIRKCAANALELAKRLPTAKKQRVCYPNNLRERLSVLAEFGDYRLLCQKHRGIFSGYSYLVWQKGMPALYRNISHDYEQAKEEFAKQANIIDSWMNLEVIRALGCAVQYYRNHSDEYRPYILEALGKAERSLADLANRGWGALYDCSLDVLDSNMRDRRMQEAEAQAPVCAD